MTESINKMIRKLNEEEDPRVIAIVLIKHWAEKRLQNYQEPTREGIPKGEKIGLSRRKYYAAILSILYPNTLKIKEIARIADVSFNVLRLWRTDEEFIQATIDEGLSFGDYLVKALKDLLDNDDDESSKTIIDVAPCFDTVYDAIRDFLVKKIQEGKDEFRYSALLFELNFNNDLRQVKSIDELKEVYRKKLPVLKNLIKRGIEALANPTIHEDYSEEDVEKIKNNLINHIVSIFDSLSR